MNVLICDDERRDLQMVRLHVEQFGKDQQIDVSIIRCGIQNLRRR